MVCKIWTPPYNVNSTVNYANSFNKQFSFQFSKYLDISGYILYFSLFTQNYSQLSFALSTEPNSNQNCQGVRVDFLALSQFCLEVGESHQLYMQLIPA